MSSVVISGDTSGTVTVAAPAVAGSNTLTLQAATATNAVNTLSTAVASTSGTSIDFTGLPSWVKRITVMFNGVSTSGTSNYLVQLGSGSFVTTGYTSSSAYTGASSASTTATTGLVFVNGNGAVDTYRGNVVITNITGNTWVSSGVLGRADGFQSISGGSLALSGTLDRVRVTTVNGTDVFDAGTVNILYEG